jgi:8-oxo-dGTP diphosphatase
MLVRYALNRALNKRYLLANLCVSAPEYPRVGLVPVCGSRERGMRVSRCESLVNHTLQIAGFHQIAAALVYRDDQILLVQQQGADDPVPTWAIPGGGVEDGELLSEALRREVREETGLQIHVPRTLAYVTQIDHPHTHHQTLAFVFEVQHWQGILQPNDPDGVILAAQFFSLADALAHLNELSWVAMREPLLVYLADATLLGSLWMYREDTAGVLERVV